MKTAACLVLSSALLAVACHRGASTTDAGAPAVSATASAKPTRVVVVEPPPVDLPKEQKTVDFGGTPTTAVVCKVDASAPAMVSKHEWDGAILSMAVAPDGTIYVVDHERKVRHYRNQSKDGCELALDDTFGTGGVWDFGGTSRGVAVDAKGNVYVSGNKAQKIVNGKASAFCAEYTRAGAFSELISADRHISRDGSCGGSLLTLKGFDPSAPQYDDPQAIGFIGDEIISQGVDMRAGKELHEVGIHAADGTMRLKVGKPTGDEAMWSISQATKCGGDVCVISGSIGGAFVHRYTLQGKFVGQLRVADLGVELKAMNLGASPAGLWLSGSMSAKDGGFAGAIVLLKKGS